MTIHMYFFMYILYVCIKLNACECVKDYINHASITYPCTRYLSQLTMYIVCEHLCEHVHVHVLSLCYRWSPIGCPVPTKPQPHPPSTATSHIDCQPQPKQTLTTGKKGKSDGSCSDSGSKKSFHNFPKLSGGREGGEVRENRKPGKTASEVVEEQITDKGIKHYIW